MKPEPKPLSLFSEHYKGEIQKKQRRQRPDRREKKLYAIRIGRKVE